MVIRRQDYTDLSDDQLMAALGDGDADCLSELVKRYETTVTRYVYRIVGDYERSRDLTQETFLRVFRAAGTYRSSSGSREGAQKVAEFGTWLFRIARNLARDELRARRRRPPPVPLATTTDEGPIAGELDPRLDRRAAARDGTTTSEPTNEAPVDEAAKRELREMVLDAIGGLPRNDKIMLLLKDIRGLAYEQIAAMLSLPLGTVKSRVSRARHKFKERYATMFENQT